jgi:hypothetical protein
MRCAEFPAPEGRLEMVAKDMQINGVPMTIKELWSKQAPQTVLQFYRQRWARNRVGTFEYPLDGWQAIATIDGRCFYTVQVQPDGQGTRALLGVSARREVSTRDPGSGFPKMSGSRVFNDIDHRDGVKTARTVMLANEFSPSTNATFYRNAFTTDGWVPTLDRTVDTPRGETHVLVLKRGIEEASLTIARSGAGSAVVANIVDRP